MAQQKNKILKAIAWDLGGNFINHAGTFIISIFLARILEPSEFGIIGMAVAAMFIFRSVLDGGFSAALIQAKEVKDVTYSSVFYLNLAIGVIIAASVVFLSPSISNFYENPEVGPVMAWLTLSLIFEAFSSIHQTQLRRNLKFKELALRAVISSFLGGIVGILLALKGAGVYALVAKNLMQAFSNMVLLWIFSKWRPKLAFSWADIATIFGFSFYSFAARTMNQVMTKADVLVIGGLFSSTTVGFYSRAVSLNSLMNTYSSRTLNRVFFPVLSQLQDNLEKHRRTFMMLLQVASFGSFMLMGFMFFASSDLIVLLFGDKWLPTVNIFQVLVLRSIAFPLNSIFANTLKSMGKSKENFWVGILRQMMILSVYVVAFLAGFQSMLWAFVIASYISIGINVFSISKILAISLNQQLRSILPYVAYLIVGYVPFYFLSWHFEFFLDDVILAILATCVYLIIAFMSKAEGVIFVHNLVKGKFKVIFKKHLSPKN